MRAVPDIASLQAQIARVAGRRDVVQTSLEVCKQEVQTLQDEQELLDLVGGLFRTLIDQEVSAGVKAVEQLQTEGLQAVFDDQDLSVKARIDIQRGKVSVDLLTVHKRPGGEIIEGLAKDEFGGSVLSLQSILLRVIVMMRRGLRPFMVLDEALPAFDSNYVANVGSFLSELCKRLGIDILMVTHQPALVEASDRAYRIVRRGGEATFQRINN